MAVADGSNSKKRAHEKSNSFHKTGPGLKSVVQVATTIYRKSVVVQTGTLKTTVRPSATIAAHSTLRVLASSTSSSVRGLFCFDRGA
jgi:hypothetical protein